MNNNNKEKNMSNVYKMFLLASFALAFTACGQFQGDRGDQGQQGSPGKDAPVPAVPAVTTEQQDVNRLIGDENEYRAGLGQAPLTQGLSCTLYTTTGGDRIQATIPGHNTLTGITQVATFLLNKPINQSNTSVANKLSLLPVALQALYTTNYLMRCQGAIVVRDSGYVKFDLSSDDGSLLFVDGSLLVDNDNAHAATTVSKQKYMRRGVHSFRLDFSQGSGNEQLILKANNTLIDPIYLVH